MADFDEVLARIQNQLDKMKKSLRGRNKELARATTTGQPRKENHPQAGTAQKNFAAQENLPGASRRKPSDR